MLNCTEMADGHKSTSVSILKRSRDEKKKNKSRNTKKRIVSESKTPPLPPGCSASIEELLKHRKTIKNELQVISKRKDKEKSSNKRNYEKNPNNKKIKKDEIHGNYKEMDQSKKMSPESNSGVKHLDSEDEEYIIEQRRKQRKLLLAQLQNRIDLKNISDSEQENSTHIEKETTLETSHNHSTKINNVTDMFSEDDFHNSNKQISETNSTKKPEQPTCNWDDEEGYLKINIGDTIDKYTVVNFCGQGVFAKVIKAQVGKDNVAIKVIRNNDHMYKTGLKEIAYLREINQTDPDDKYHCVRLISHFMHKGHLCLVLEYLYMDLRSVLKKYGKKHGINLRAVMSYSQQILLALRHLSRIGIIHADIKPDNIIVNEKKNLLKLCDFGSAGMVVNGSDTTPYLVSRFYRAPEIILGIPYTSSIDMWSAGCTIYEITTGKILFTGSSNNKMLKCFMDLKGKIPMRLLRKSRFKDQHFNYSNNFLLHKVDEFTRRDRVMEISNIHPNRDLYKELLKGNKTILPIEGKKIMQLKDMLDKMLMLDANQRLSVVDSLKHAFIREEFPR